VSALEKAFYLSFGFVTPTGKRYVLALDVSGSMGCGGVAGSCVTPREAAAAMAMVTLKTEKRCHPMAFSTQLVPVLLTENDNLFQAQRAMNGIPMGGTDCAQPMVWAAENNIEADVFIVYTDCETWAGKVTPANALRAYREKMGIYAKLVVVAMTSGGFSIADPEDAGMLDVVGFDTATPQVMQEFIMGSV
jgi:60 kDa SS-A/Ro ribonucleoprotein